MSIFSELLEAQLLLTIEEHEEMQTCLADRLRNLRLFDPERGQIIRRDMYGYYQTHC